MSREKTRTPLTQDGGFKGRFRWVLEHFGISQSGAARRLGIAQGVISGWLSGRHRPSASTRNLICVTFGINEAWLTEGNGPIYKEGQVAEAPEPYGDLERSEKKILDEVADLLRQGGETRRDILNALNVVKRAARLPKKRAAG